MTGNSQGKDSEAPAEEQEEGRALSNALDEEIIREGNE